MKKAGILCSALLLMVSFAWSQELVSVTRLGGSFSTEFADSPKGVTEVKDSFFNGATIIPGFELEILRHHVGLNFRTGLMFRSEDSSVEYLERTWTVDARPEFGFRLHIFGWDSFLDPFVEANVGTGVMVDITGYEEADEDLRQPLRLGWYAGLGAGMNIVLGNVYAGGTLRANLIDDAFPGTQYTKYDIAPFSFSLHVGFNFESWMERTLFGYRKAR